MQIPSEIRKKWKLLRDHGDVTVIAKETGYSKITIAKALNKGESTIDVLQKVDAFYEKREQLLKSA